MPQLTPGLKRFVRRGWIGLGAVMLIPRLFGQGAPPPALDASTTVTATPAPKAQKDTSNIQLGQSCVTTDCHGDLKQAKFQHGPVNLNQCTPCHEPQGGKHVFAAAKGGPGLCYVCHEQSAPKAVVHKPFAADCTGCHNPHGGSTRYFTRGETAAETCNKCHGKVTSGMNFIHGPVAMGQCMACHSPHQSDNKHLLTDPPNQLCQACHVDVQQELASAVSIHAPAKDGCTGCHNAHGGATKNLLVAEGQDLCKTCHGDFLKQVNQHKFSHQPMTEGKACQNCHKPHASNQARLLMSDNMALCLSCHNQEIKAGKRTIANVEAQIKNSKYLHGPIKENNCIACHEAHGSENPNILDKAFPANFYAPFEDHAYDLCFNCHDKQLVMKDKNVSTGFRNGDVNLHFMHVNREKGRSCRACHDEHASNQPKHIRAEVPFGRWKFQTEYTKTETGGGCTTGCHMPYKYDRNAPVDNKRVAAK